jgi:hypothetical protein
MKGKRKNMREETKQKISNYRKKLYSDPVERQKQSERMRNPITRRKSSIASKQAFANPDIKARHLAALNKPETRKRLSDAAKERCKDPNYFKKLLDAANTPEAKTKQTITAKKLWKNPEWKKKMVSSIFTEQTLNKMKESARKRSQNPVYLKKLKDSAKRGASNHMWKGGISYGKYCQKFNYEFKERVREFFGRVCIECGTPENGKRHTVHHINYNKMVCCNDVKPLFACLCTSCNTKANNNRKYWEQYFTDIINNYYGGKCYLSKEEMELYISKRDTQRQK